MDRRARADYGWPIATRRTDCLDLAERLGAAVDFVEAHLREEPCLEAAAERAGFSTWHFIRVFQAACGFTPMEYLRRRRLSQAVAALARGEEVITVALECGYESQATFTRAFSRVFGVPPSRYRRQALRGEVAPLAIVPPFEPRAPWTVPPPPPPRLVERGPSHWIGASLRVDNRHYQAFEDLPSFWADWLRRDRWRALRGIDPMDHGSALLRPLVEGDVEYAIAVEVEAGTPAPSGFRAFDLPAARYAVFEAEGEPVRTVQSIALSVYAGGLASLRERRDYGGWDLERYDHVPGAPSDRLLRCGLWVPLARPGVDLARVR